MAREFETQFEEATPNGGFKTHIKPLRGHAALCGYFPSSPIGTHFQRGRWKQRQRGVDLNVEKLRWCEKCRRAYLKGTK